jgi:hypothetical protein
VNVFGPQGVEEVVSGFNMAYSIDSEQRVAHHGPEIVPHIVIMTQKTCRYSSPLATG